MNASRIRICVLLFFTCAAVAIPTGTFYGKSLAAASQYNLFPVFGSDQGGYIGLSLTNLAPTVNQVTITWTDGEGIETRTNTLALAQGAQRVALVREILSMPDDPNGGWIRIDSSEQGLASYMTTGRDESFDGMEPASSVSTSIILPHVTVETGFVELGYTDTLAALVNPGVVAANARAELIGLDGSAVGNLAISIPPRACSTFTVSQAFRDVLPTNSAGGRTFRGHMRVSSDAGLAGWLRIDMPLSRRLVRGLGADEVAPVRLLMASHFASGGSSLYRTELDLINAGSTPLTLELTAEDNRGGRIGEVIQRTLNPGQGIREDVISLFRVVTVDVYPPPMIDGYVRIRAAGGGTFQAVGDIEITSGNTTASMIYPVREPFSSDAVLPFVVSDAEYFTGYAISNPNELLTVQLDVSVALFDGDGRLVGSPRNISLSPAARFVTLIEEKARGGYLRIHANGPFSAVGSIGTRNCSMLGQLPALPVSAP